MKSAKIQIGSKQSTRKPFDVDVQEAETIGDALKLAGLPESAENAKLVEAANKLLAGNEHAARVVKGFMRAFNIFRQDGVGRPMFLNGSKDAEIVKAVTAALYGATQRVGRPKTPPTVQVPNKPSFTQAEVAAMLAAKGIKAEIV